MNGEYREKKGKEIGKNQRRKKSLLSLFYFVENLLLYSIWLNHLSNRQPQRNSQPWKWRPETNCICFAPALLGSYRCSLFGHTMDRLMSPAVHHPSSQNINGQAREWMLLAETSGSATASDEVFCHCLFSGEHLLQIHGVYTKSNAPPCNHTTPHKACKLSIQVLMNRLPKRKRIQHGFWLFYLIGIRKYLKLEKYFSGWLAQRVSTGLVLLLSHRHKATPVRNLNRNLSIIMLLIHRGKKHTSI